MHEIPEKRQYQAAPRRPRAAHHGGRANSTHQLHGDAPGAGGGSDSLGGKHAGNERGGHPGIPGA